MNKLKIRINITEELTLDEVIEQIIEYVLMSDQSYQYDKVHEKPLALEIKPLDSWDIDKLIDLYSRIKAFYYSSLDLLVISEGGMDAIDDHLTDVGSQFYEEVIALPFCKIITK